jgi:hydroxyacylglutathione hydrolase
MNAITALPAFQDNYIWVINDEPNRRFACVDPGDAKPVLHYAQTHGLHLNTVLITHHHADHIGGLQALLTAFPQARVYAPPDRRIPMPFIPVSASTPVIIGSQTFDVLHTPGHTNTHVCYYETKNQVLFCGDTLFSAGCGRVFDSTIDHLFDSLQTLKQLPDSTTLYCTHEYTRHNLRFAALIEPNNIDIKNHTVMLQHNLNQCSLPSTLELEKKINPFLRTHLPDIQSYAVLQGLNPESAREIFEYLRYKKDIFV